MEMKPQCIFIWVLGETGFVGPLLAIYSFCSFKTRVWRGLQVWPFSHSSSQSPAWLGGREGEGGFAPIFCPSPTLSPELSVEVHK